MIPFGHKGKGAKQSPLLTSMLSYFHNPAVGTPVAIRMPYSMYDNGKQMAGEGAGWLGAKHDPVLLRTPAGKAYAGVNRYSDKELNLKLNLSEKWATGTSFEQLEDTLSWRVGHQTAYDQQSLQANGFDILLVRLFARPMESEDPRIRAMYGDQGGAKPSFTSVGGGRVP